MSESLDLELRLDPSGRILEIIHPELAGLHLEIGSSLMRYLDETGHRVFFDALKSCTAQGYCLETRLTFRTPDWLEPVAVLFLREGTEIRLVSLPEAGKTLRVLEEVIRINGDLINDLRRGYQSRKPPADPLTSFQEITKLNSELVNAQRELTKQNRELERLNHMLESFSFIDDLTQIGNRRKFFRDVSNLLKDQSLHIVMMDVNRFKEVNDSRGHEYGDRVLQALASRLETLAKAVGGSAYRLGGDEFAVLLPGAFPNAFSDHRREIDEMLAELHPEISLAFGEDLLTPEDLRTGRLEKHLSETDARMYFDKHSRR
ncbi:MAG TPA: GGDEF domain-containing protein [Bacillota bacterium]|nr:GGDEF domain-containing protein [Bacillota bacterium]